jgi:hypothetical protein
MRKIETGLAVILSLFIAGCWSIEAIDGSGKVISETRSVSGFSAVSLSGDGKLLIEPGNAEALTITSDDNILPYLTSEVEGNELRLGVRRHFGVNPTRDIVYRLTVKNLNEVNVSGDGSVDGKGIRADELRIHISGDGQVVLAGSAGQQTIDISGDGRYKGEKLESKTAKISISGDGSAVAAVSDELNANVSGDGWIEYIGNPSIRQHISGDGAIRKR